ncbi:MAG: VCBS repeat-containing protein, partial [Deltaproteobacteria bacterium]|nr:VCBS repeat-containing protein [Nannocystaceae bacterium]
TAGAARVMTVGRVDLDPYPDVVSVADDGRASVLLNDGSGGLASAIDAAAFAPNPSGVGLGDVDGSGWQELVVSTDDGRLAIAPVGDTGFGAPVVAASGLQNPLVPTVGNFFADLQGGVPDVAVLVGDGMDVVPQSSALAFDAPVHTEIDEPSDLATLSAEGARALVARATQNDVQVLERTQDGLYVAVATIDVGGPPARFVHADLDGDDYLDILAATEDGKLWLTTSKTAAPQSAEDWAKPQLVYELGWVPSVLSVGDLDDDDDLELVVAGVTTSGRSDVFLFDNDGDGVPIYGGSLGVVDGTAVATGELDGDGVPEIMVAGAAPTAIRIARRTVAPPPPGTSTTGDSGTMPETGVEPSETGTSDPTIDPTIDPSGTEFGEETFGPGCPGYEIDWMCYAAVDKFEHGMPEVTGLVQQRALDVVYLLGSQAMAAEGEGAMVQVLGLGVPGSYELGGSIELPQVPTSGDAGFLLDGLGADLAVTTPDGVFVFSGELATFAAASGQNPRELAMTDIGDDVLGDVVMVVDGGMGLLRGSTIASGVAGEMYIEVEVFPMGEFTDFDVLPDFGKAEALGLVSRPSEGTLGAIGFDDEAQALGVIGDLPGANANYAAFGVVWGDPVFQPFLLAASLEVDAPTIELAIGDNDNNWTSFGSIGSAEGLVHDLLVLDFDLDGNDDLLAMYDDGTGVREIRVLLWRGEGFEHVASIYDVFDAQHMVAIYRDGIWDLLVVGATEVHVFTQVFSL